MSTPEQRAHWRSQNHKAYAAHREERIAKSLAYKRANPEKVKIWSADRYDRKPDYWRLWSLRRKYGISETEYAALLEAQGGVCAICQEPETRARNGQVLWLCVDHDHETGRIRGLLCHRCNAAIGKLATPKLLRAAIGYLTR